MKSRNPQCKKNEKTFRDFNATRGGHPQRQRLYRPYRLSVWKQEKYQNQLEKSDLQPHFLIKTYPNMLILKIVLSSLEKQSPTLIPILLEHRPSKWAKKHLTYLTSSNFGWLGEH